MAATPDVQLVQVTGDGSGDIKLALFGNFTTLLTAIFRRPSFGLYRIQASATWSAVFHVSAPSWNTRFFIDYRNAEGAWVRYTQSLPRAMIEYTYHAVPQDAPMLISDTYEIRGDFSTHEFWRIGLEGDYSAGLAVDTWCVNDGVSAPPVLTAILARGS